MACVTVGDDDAGVREVLASYLRARQHQTIQAAVRRPPLRPQVPDNFVPDVVRPRNSATHEGELLDASKAAGAESSAALA